MNNISLDRMIETTLTRHVKGPGIRSGMQNVADRYAAGDFYGISEDCTSVVWDIADVFACNYFQASNFFAAEMRKRYQINVV
jgi:hypothetical protein